MSAILNSLRNLASSSRASSGDSGARFSVTPGAGDGCGEGGYTEWLRAMRLVARLPAGVPHHFRRKLWLTLSDRYLSDRGIEWSDAERNCFRGTAQPDDAELGAQILKDLHRTGCSLFCGTEGRENQAMLRRVLLAYARWNKEVGYCQGFNMLAAIILEVMDKSESDSLKVMIYLVEAVLPEGYFADDLRGLSADMAAFRDLLRLRLPKLANHMDYLQKISDGGGVEPPLPDVFTMQWFLTLYATWLPRESLLRVWDLILLDGNEVLLLTALAIWDMLQDRILSSRSADEYYSCMGGGAGAVWEAGEALVARVVTLDSAPELPRLRNIHRYRVTPPAPPGPINQPPLHSAVQTMTKRGLRLFYSEDEGDSSDDGNKMALAAVVPRRDERIAAGDRLSLDIGALKRQYARLRERQRQAHVILAAACARHAAVGIPTSPTSLTVNNLLLGKSAIISSRGRRLGPPPGAVPPSRHSSTSQDTKSRSNEDDTISWKDEKNKKHLSRRDSLQWKDIKKDKHVTLSRKASIDLDESGDGIIVSETEANEMIASLRSRSVSESSSYSSHSSSSTDTSLCDEGASDSETKNPPNDDKRHKSSHLKHDTITINTEIKNKSPTHSKTTEKSRKLITTPINTNLEDYIESSAGKSLRTYIDEFSYNVNNDNGYTKSINLTPQDNNETYESINSENNSLINKKYYDSDISYKSEDVAEARIFISKSFTSDSSNITNLSPIEISPCAFIPDETDRNFKFELSSLSSEVNRPPDIIDSLVKYPNFVPDIELSDKTVSDVDSPIRSPGAESIVISEDEPPIPLKIDKYFEHSPEFFGARITVTDSCNPDIPNRRATKRLSRLARKPDSLTLQSSHNENLNNRNVEERSISLPQNPNLLQYLEEDTERNKLTYLESKNLKFYQCDFQVNLPTDDILETGVNVKKIEDNPQRNEIDTINKETYIENSVASNVHFAKDRDDYLEISKFDDKDSPNDFVMPSGRKNSERALQIIQENSKILSRILTKQYMSETMKSQDSKESHKVIEQPIPRRSNNLERNLSSSPFLKESTSDSLIGYNQSPEFGAHSGDKTDFMRNRPISIDDPLSLDLDKMQTNCNTTIKKGMRKPSPEDLSSKTDSYGWENKGFLAKFHCKDLTEKSNDKDKYGIAIKSNFQDTTDEHIDDAQAGVSIEWSREHDTLSIESKTSVTLPSSDRKDIANYERRFTSDDYNYPFSSRYNDFVLSTASDICSKTLDLGPKVCEKTSKTENASQASDFAQIVTSSISFTYEPSVEDDSPMGAKSNSSDTLCQIMSLDQVSTPISPKIFPNRETPTLSKESADKSDRVKLDSDDTCSAITSLIETDTLSSLSYPRSPSTNSFHHFPTRPSLRMPKELGIRLGMYPKDSINSPSK